MLQLNEVNSRRYPEETNNEPNSELHTVVCLAACKPQEDPTYFGSFDNNDNRVEENEQEEEDEEREDEKKNTKKNRQLHGNLLKLNQLQNWRLRRTKGHQ